VTLAISFSPAWVSQMILHNHCCCELKNRAVVQQHSRIR
jgi:hypothetical protein